MEDGISRVVSSRDVFRTFRLSTGIAVGLGEVGMKGGNGDGGDESETVLVGEGKVVGGVGERRGLGLWE